MKYVLITAALMLGLSTYSQSTEDKLKTALTNIESKDSVINGQRVTNLKVIVEKYNVISLKEWLKTFYEIDNEFNQGMNVLYAMANQQDSVQGIHSTDSVLAEMEQQKRKDTSGFDRKTYIKNVYETADTSIKVFKILYHTEFNLGVLQSGKSSENKALYVKDLSEVKLYR